MLFQFLLVRLRAGSGDYYRVPVERFQFLLVRLRAGNTQEQQLTTTISIPSGAIKSRKYSGTAAYDYNFNSFWCD